MDKIIISGISLWCSLGITEHERTEKQPVLVDLTLHRDLSIAGKSDDVNDTTNYSHVFSCVRACSEKTFNTLEALATCICSCVKEKFGPEKVIVLIKKPGALARKGVAYAAVEIER